jgi:hypothetical protein
MKNNIRALILLGVIGAVIAVALGFFIYGIYINYRAEIAYRTTQMVISIVDKYVQDRKQWPTSWEDLEHVKYETVVFYSWPRDSAEIQKIVKINFNLKLEDLVDETPETFQAIQPLGPIYNWRDYTKPLIESIRKCARPASSDNSDNTVPIP